MKKTWKSLTSICVLAVALAGCGSNAPAGEKNAQGTGSSDLPKQIVIATGGTSGTYYPLGGELAKLVHTATGVEANVQTTGGSIENAKLIGDQQVDIAFMQTDVADYASKGTVMFEGKQVENLKAIGTLYSEAVQLVTLKNTGVTTVEDLKGKKVSVGAPGSATEANVKQIFEAYNLTLEDVKPQRLSYAESADALRDGTIDAAFITAGTPTTAISELSATKDVVVVPFDEAKVEAIIQKYPFFAKITIPKDTYKGMSADLTTVALRSMLVVRGDLSEQAVYDLTKGIYDHLDKITHAKAKEIKVENAIQGLSIEVHAGAKKYFDEKGVK